MGDASPDQQMKFVETGDHAAGVATLSYLPTDDADAQTLVTAGGDGMLHFRDAKGIAQDPKSTLECTGAPLDVAVSTEGDLIATALEDGIVSLFKKERDGEAFSPDTDVTRFTLPARTLDFSSSDR